MSDVKDTIDEARVALRRAAARMLARRDALDAELGGLADDPAHAERAEGLRAERRTAQSDLDATLAELKDLDRVERDAVRAQHRALIDGALARDPVASDPVDAALENVRGHLAALEAEVRVGAELAAEGPRPDPAAVAEARARAQLEALKAERKRQRDAADEPGEG